MLTLSNSLYTLAVRIKEVGGCLYIVGGAVRDYLRGMSAHDYDLCVTGLTPAQLQQLIPNAKPVGVDFPVYIVTVGDEVHELALARRERKINQGHTGFKVDFAPDTPIEVDLGRRDLTVNAMAIKVISGELIDLYDGQRHIKAGLLQVVNPAAFKEDPLRVYRVARFAATLNYRPSDELTKLMGEMTASLTELSQERVVFELEKALHGLNPVMFFKTLQVSDVLRVHFSELTPAKIDERLKTLAIVTRLTTNISVRWNALCQGERLAPKLVLPKSWGKVSGYTQLSPNWSYLDLVIALDVAERTGLGVEGLVVLNTALGVLLPFNLFKYWSKIKATVNGTTIVLPDEQNQRGIALQKAKASALATLIGEN